MATAALYPETWELDSILPHPDTAMFADILDEYRKDLERVAELSDRLPPVSTDSKGVQAWVEFLKQYEDVSRRAGDLASFIGCYSAADAENKNFQKLEAQLAALDPFRERMGTNVELTLRGASDDEIAAFVAADPYLQSLRYVIHDRRRFARLRLPREQELLAADLAVDGLHAWGRLYDRISGELKIRVMEKGEIVEKSPGQVQFDSPQRAVRENNFFAANKAWSSIADTCADAINHIAGTRLTRYRRLDLADHLVAPLSHNRMRRESLDAMWNAINARKPVLVEYMNRKAKMLGLEKLAWYDLTAPLPQGDAKSSEKLAYDDACRLVISTFTAFSPDLGDFARNALEKQWIEVENRPGKRQGGFCTGFPTSRESRIFMTFTNTADSMSTLAHELGHAYHSHVLRDEPLFLQDYPMNLAETASTFAEAVLVDQRLNETRTKEEQLAILDNMASDSVVYLMNIHCRFLFENLFHTERVKGEVSAARLSELMIAAQKEAYCDGLAADGWNPNFWISKLHF
ncbi:MAG: M3 family oligoendopeptidase, partial [Planctomycetaceae bacterium]